MVDGARIELNPGSASRRTIDNYRQRTHRRAIESMSQRARERLNNFLCLVLYCCRGLSDACFDAMLRGSRGIIRVRHGLCGTTAAWGSSDREAFCRLLLVQMKLRTRMLASDEAEDLPQEGLVVSEYYRRCRRSLKPMKRFRSIEHYIYIGWLGWTTVRP